MKKTALLVFFFSLLVAVGGIMGFVKAQSLPSLIGGLGFSLLLDISGFAMIKKKKIGAWAALILCFILDAFFTFRFAKSLTFFPAGFMSLLSLCMVIILALRINTACKRN